ncbi:hypothetical protein Q9L58_008754 [Maublancomyces gigas]|uniref:cellulose 1,4-beta-cellobiosidase (non-reducing end) n=1 Tax=Discina gigas TaxID=1032678 RepID=A0ABR3G8W1_9PEZI
MYVYTATVAVEPTLDHDCTASYASRQAAVQLYGSTTVEPPSEITPPTTVLLALIDYSRTTILLTTQKCTKNGSCTKLATSVVLDANWRWLHTTTGFTNRYVGNTWDMKVNISSKFTVVTQFLTAGNTITGDLIEIRCLYVQNGVVI